MAVAEPYVVRRGGIAQLNMSLTGAPGNSFVDVLATSNATGATVPVTKLGLTGGRATFSVVPAGNTTYRLRYAGTDVVAPAQADVVVLVRRSISLLGRATTSTASARVGVPVKLTAGIDPASSGISVSFRLYRLDPVRRAWVYAGSFGRKTDSIGRASLTWVPKVFGSYYWRTTVASSAAYANNTSSIYRWSVRR